MDAKHELLLDWTDRTEGSQLIMALLSTARAVDAACAELLAPHDLSEGRLAVLLALREREPLAPARIAERLGVTKATVTGLAAGLERSGLVLRQADPADRRSALLRLSEAGAELLERLAPRYRSWLAEAAAGIGAADLRAAARTLEALHRALSPPGAQKPGTGSPDPEAV